MCTTSCKNSPHVSSRRGDLWTHRGPAGGPVDKVCSSPARTHSTTPLPERKRGIIPVLHTPYDYNKGIS
jgi:hypothetical protein